MNNNLNLDDNETIKITYRDIEFEIDMLGYFKDKNGNNIFLVDPVIVNMFRDNRGKVGAKRFIKQPLDKFIKRLAKAYHIQEAIKDYDQQKNNKPNGNNYII